MKLTVNKALHSRYALLKAAYHFTDEYYVLLDQDETSYYADGSSSSTNGASTNETQKPTVQPDDKTENNNDNSHGSSTYVLNTNTKKFHYPSCGSAKKIATKNYAESNESRDSLIAQGYSPCGNCDP